MKLHRTQHKIERRQTTQCAKHENERPLYSPKAVKIQAREKKVLRIKTKFCDKISVNKY